MAKMHERKLGRLKRKKRIRKKVFGTTTRPRLTIFRSSKHIYAQVIDDQAGHTIASASTVEKTIMGHPDVETMKDKKSWATLVGKLIAERSLEKGVKKIVFDRNGYMYHGRVKAVSDGAREKGLEF